MEKMNMLNDEELEKVTGGEADNSILEGDITESRDWCCKNGHYFTVEDAYRFGNLCPVCNEKLEVTDHSICLPHAVANI